MTRASISIELMSRADQSGRQWVHLLPSGEFHGIDGRGPYAVVDPSDVIEQSRQHAGRRQMPIDYDHAIDLAAPQGQAAPAAGWVTGLQSRSDGIWGMVEWTPRAAQQLSQREYRYLSPVIKHTPAGKVIALLRASLTNNPNLELTALASRQETKMDALAELRKELGLPEDASLEDVLNKVRERPAAAHAAAHDPAKFVPIGDFERTVAELRRVNQGVSLQAAELHVAAQVDKGHLPPFLKDWGVQLCSVNKPAFDKFVERTGKGFAHLFTETHARGIPTQSQPSDLTSEEAAIASNLGVTPEAFLKTRAARGGAKETR